MRTAAPTQRAEDAACLARAYLDRKMDEPARRDAEIALTALIHDPSPLVRRALAENFAGASDAPHALVAALADDRSDVAEAVLARSPLLTDAELIDRVTTGDACAQSAIARRARVPAAVSAALAELGAREAALALALNPGAELAEFSMRRMIERFGRDGEMREAVLARPNLPAIVRSALAAATAACLAAFVADRAWLSPERAERVSREARDQANAMIGADAARRDGRAGAGALAAYLRESGQLTPGLVLSALLSGERDFAESVMEARWECPLPEVGEAGASLHMIERVLAACEELGQGELDRLKALLRRLEEEAAPERGAGASQAAMGAAA